MVTMMMMSCLSSSPNFYILDEPTNHLDMETIEALAKALNKFKVRLFDPPSFLFRADSLESHLWCHVSGRGRPGVARRASDPAGVQGAVGV